MSSVVDLHPLCTLFPRLSGSEFEILRDDIKANGLRQPIVLHQGMILDGGNRYRACIEAGIAPIFEDFVGGNLVSFVLSANLHRRHMSPGQQAAIVASAQDWAKAQTVGNPALKAGQQKCNVAPLDTAADRAAQSGASLRTQKMADKVAKADPELSKKVAHGETTLPKAVAKVEGRESKPKRTVEEARRDSEPRPKPIEQNEDDDAFGDFDPIAELESAHKEIENLNAQVAALSSDDVSAELAKEIRSRQGIEARLGQEMTRCGALDKELRWFGKQYEQLRKILGVESNSKVLAAVKNLMREAA